MNLAQKKKKPNSRYWKGKADDEWSKQIRAVGCCEICGKKGRLNAHHLINRTRLRYRHDLSNGVCLCVRCHCFDSDISPHADSYSNERFMVWLRKERPGQFDWYEAHKHDKRKPDKTYKQSYEELKGGE